MINLHKPKVFIVQMVHYGSFIKTGSWFSKQTIFPFSVTVLFLILLRRINEVYDEFWQIDFRDYLFGYRTVIFYAAP